MQGLLGDRGLKFLSDIVDLFLPGICPLCGERMDFTDVVCEGCMSRLKRSPMMRLGMNLKFIDSVWCYGKYEDTLSDAIKVYKYEPVPSMHKLFVNFMVRMLESAKIDLEGFKITNVPPTLDSLLSKGFDHTGIIAKKISESLGIEYVSLLKAKNRKPQVGLKTAERKRNVVGKYRLRKVELPRKVLIFDDVITTGSTLEECGKVLKMAGVSEIHGLVLACSTPEDS